MKVVSTVLIGAIFRTHLPTSPNMNMAALFSISCFQSNFTSMCFYSTRRGNEHCLIETGSLFLLFRSSVLCERDIMASRICNRFRHQQGNAEPAHLARLHDVFRRLTLEEGDSVFIVSTIFRPLFPLTHWPHQYRLILETKES